MVFAGPENVTVDVNPDQDRKARVRVEATFSGIDQKPVKLKASPEDAEALRLWSIGEHGAPVAQAEAQAPQQAAAQLDPQTTEYIRTCRAQGIPDDQIVTALVGSGWQEAQAREAVRRA